MSLEQPNNPTRRSAAGWIAFLLVLLWLFSVAAFVIMTDTLDDIMTPQRGPLFTFVIVVAIFLPVALIALMASGARRNTYLQRENASLKASMATIANRPTDPPARASNGFKIKKTSAGLAPDYPPVTQKVAMFSSARKAMTLQAIENLPPSPDEVQTGFFGDQPQQGSIDSSVLIKALNFPDNNQDQEGFEALRQVLGHRLHGLLIKSAQDVLTGLADDGIYMDELAVDGARPDLWRRFAQGERDGVISTLGGVRDKSILALTAGRMRIDPEFRSKAHQFLNRYDRMLQKFEETASDVEMVAITNTRTSTAFMLIGRVSQIFGT